MKRRSRKQVTASDDAVKAGPAVSARVLVTELPRNSEEVLARSDASALAENLYKRAIESGEPISADLVQYVADLSRGGASAELLKAVPIIQGAKKRVTKLHEGKRQSYENRRMAALIIAARLMKEDRRLRQLKKRSELARLVQAELPLPQTDDKKRTAVRTIRRWLAEASTPKNNF
jgi:hypothetical protein